MTLSSKITDYARICIEMKVGSDISKTFDVETEFMERFEVKVEYSWKPRKCVFCNVFGYSLNTYPFQAKPKPKSTPYTTRQTNLQSHLPSQTTKKPQPPTLPRTLPLIQNQNLISKTPTNIHRKDSNYAKRI